MGSLGNFPDPSIARREGPRVALTFDAEHPDRPLCPPGATESILDTLAEAGVAATFFVQGRWATSRPDLARRIADQGHLIGHHSKFHTRMPLLSDDGIRADVVEGQEEVISTTGRDPRPWFRCPFGAGHDDDRVLKILSELGYRDVHWDVEVEDWEPWRTAADLERDAVAGTLAHGDGAVVLLHTWPAPTAAALPVIVSRLTDAGATFSTVEELGV
jgi:peptidoglycan-N-acetylglucosamine deacetylase